MGVLTKFTNKVGGTERKIGSMKWRENLLFGVVCVCSLVLLLREKETKAIRGKYCTPSPLLHMKFIQSLHPIEYMK